VPAPADRQDLSPPVVDPYDPEHLLMAAHERELVVETVDGGRNWTAVQLNPGMASGPRSGAISFINTGNSSTTRTTWLWTSEASGGQFGTWRTATGGTTWTLVDRNEHQVGSGEAFQLDGSGAIYMAGVYSDLGWGVLRSHDYGVTWSSVGNRGVQRVVFGSPKNIYSSYSFPSGIGSSADPAFQTALFPGTGGWSQPATPAAMRQGASQVAIGFDGSSYFFVSANLNAGLWRYVEP